MEDDLTVDIDLRAYWIIIEHWLWLIILAALLAGTTAYAMSRWLVEPVYSATVRLVIQPSSSLSGSNYSDIMAGQRAALTYAEILKGLPVQETTLLQLGYSEVQVAQFVETNNFPYELTVQPVRDTQVIEIGVESTNPQLVANFANTLAQVFIEQNQERQAARYQNTQERLQEQVQSVEEDIGRIKAQLASTTDTVEHARLETQITQLQDSLVRLSIAYQSIQLAELQAVDLISVIGPARVPQAPVRPRKAMNALLSAVVGAMVAVGGVFLRENLDTTVKSPEEVESLAQLPVLGKIWDEPTLSSINGAGDRMVVLARPLSITAEAYRLLRANLQFAAVDHSLKALLITSPAPQDGKSTVALNLGLVLGAAGKRVILVDADMRRPQLCHYTGVKREPGLSEALVDRSTDWRDYLKPVEGAENVMILPPGKHPPNPSELLGSRRMAELLKALRQIENVVVVIDSPPVLAAADAVILAPQVDGVLTVLRVGQTDQRAAAQSIEQLRRSGARLIGTVLSRVPTGGKSGYYYYYYSSEEKEARKSLWPWRKKQERKSRVKSAKSQVTSHRWLSKQSPDLRGLIRPLSKTSEVLFDD